MTLSEARAKAEKGDLLTVELQREHDGIPPMTRIFLVEAGPHRELALVLNPECTSFLEIAASHLRVV